jgi:hypothetical protein
LRRRLIAGGLGQPAQAAGLKINHEDVGEVCERDLLSVWRPRRLVRFTQSNEAPPVSTVRIHDVDSALVSRFEQPDVSDASSVGRPGGLEEADGSLGVVTGQPQRGQTPLPASVRVDRPHSEAKAQGCSFAGTRPGEGNLSPVGRPLRVKFGLAETAAGQLARVSSIRSLGVQPPDVWRGCVTAEDESARKLLRVGPISGEAGN